MFFLAISDQKKKKIGLLLLLLLVFLISILAYRWYFKNGWYVLDDYASLAIGGADSIINSAMKAINWLYTAQGRYQPVRNFLVFGFMHSFQEEYAVYYNFGLHLINLALLFFLLRKFNINYVYILLTVLLFSLFGNYRMMEGPVTMIGGTGLNLFFILVTLLFLIKTFETSESQIRRWVFFAISFLAYFGLVFSYEVAFPLFLTVIYVFFLFYFKDKTRVIFFRFRSYLYLLPYFIALFGYLIFFKIPAKGHYVGAEIVWNFTNIATRFKSYLNYTLFFPIEFKIGKGGIALLLYFTAIIIASKMDRRDMQSSNNRIQDSLKVLVFGIIFYISSMILFVLNNWWVPTQVMVHHIYLMTAGSSIVIISILLNIRWIFIEPIKKVYHYLLVAVVFPVILLSGFNMNIEFYKQQAERTDSIKLMKHKMQNSIENVEKIDAIIVKNFFSPYYHMRVIDGAFLQWFDFKRYIHSGREIVSLENDMIKFKGPLDIYSGLKEFEFENKRVEIFYLNERDHNLLSYYDFINLEEGTNIYQTYQVKKDDLSIENNGGYIVEAILKNITNHDYIRISFKSADELKGIMKSLSIALNDKPVKQILVSDNTLFIDIKKLKDRVNYFFIKITTDENIKRRLKTLSISNLEDGAKFFETSLPIKNEIETPLILDWKGGFYYLESNITDNWRWCSSEGELHINNTLNHEKKVVLKMTFHSSYNSNLRIESPLFSTNLKIKPEGVSFSKKITIPKGDYVIKFKSDATRLIAPNDSRFLVFNIGNFGLLYE